MKKILLFAAALLGSLSMMADSYEWETMDNLGLTFASADGAVKVRSTTNGVYESKGLYDNANQYGIKIANSANANLDTSYIEIAATSEISELQLGFSSNGTSTKKYVVAYCSSSPFNKDNIIGQEVTDACVKTAAKADGIHAFTLPEGTQSVRIYRKAKINNVDYGDGSTVYMYYLNITLGTPSVKYTVSYYDGANLRGTETVKEGETPTKAAQYETKPHATFNGWYNDNGLTVLANLGDPITSDKDFYGKWTADAFTASTSINIEQGVLDNGKAWDVASALTTAHIAYGDIDALDSLTTKEGRNEPFLGLKLKTAGAYVEAGLNAGDVIRVKFGNVAADVKINGATVAKATLATPYEYTATAQEYVRIETTTGGTVVLKQIMINQPIADVVLPTVDNDVTLATLTLDGVTIPGFNASTKTYTITLEEGTTLPVVAATAHDANATVGAITQATTLPGDASFVVTAADGTTTATYTIHFVLPREIEYLTAPYETSIPADFVMPDWLAGCTVNTAYMGADTVVAGHDVIRFEKTDTVSMYINSCDSVIVDLSATGGRTVAIAVNGEEKANSGSFKSNTLKTLGALIHSEGQVIVNIYGVDVTGGTTISRIKVTAYNPITTATEYMEAAPKAVKRIINGQLFIEKNGVLYNALGAKL